ncbi:single-stranded-DNA-specific exonuclease RecJ [Halalkalibacter urbisdiaboli]|uniref:single-stranded-DNA-specific exonuclease RecJ n=1 Tax=Halalkalibacter urbisdiaboli TaxID=1960589 RepID=UPI000B445FB3|nr:single-stranded-DNA-specific exonuclease RecJ [Halalkalibacter urbisdiaboli]
MLKPRARWNIQEQDNKKVETLVEHLNIVPLVAKLLLNRGIETIEEAKTFLYKENMDYHDPFLLDGMQEAVARIRQAIDDKERILVFGDYDADGVSSTAVMVYTLRYLKADFDYYIPNRFTEGYGPNEPALRKAKEDGYSLVVTVDTGISAVHEAAVAREIGLDFIVTDHHEAPPVLPDAYAIVNPKKPGCTYPFKGLAGVGVAFKVAHALLERVPVELLDIAVIGTIADLVPLVDENRLIAKEGLFALQESEKPGLIALKKVCGFGSEMIQADHVGFGIGPRINAAGRLAAADPAVELLITDNRDEAKQLATNIDELNKERQGIVNGITEEAVAMVEQFYPPSENQVLIVAKEGWNPGVIGIVASRLVERFYRPTIVLSIDSHKGVAKGSARSIEGFDMFAELSKNREILPHFGGHPMAAGLTMKIDDVDILRKRLNEQAMEVLSDEDFIPVSNIDLVADIEELSLSVIQQLDELAPFGVSNPTPKVMLNGVSLAQIRRIGSESNHLKINFSQNGNTLDGIGFHLGHLQDEMSSSAKVSAVGTLSVNEWNGHVKPQIMLEDLAVDEWQLFDWRSIQKHKIVDRLSSLPNEKRMLIAFQQETVKRLQLDEWTITQPESITQLQGKYAVFLDLPSEKEQLTKLFVGAGVPERVYTVFHQEEDSFFTSDPNREQFKWFYAFLMKRKSFDVKNKGQELAKYKGWSPETVEFMARVFLELGFITVDQGMIIVTESPEKKRLEDSTTYRRKKAQAQLENDFVYSSYAELKMWFDQAMEEKNEKEQVLKETV